MRGDTINLRATPRERQFAQRVLDLRAAWDGPRPLEYESAVSIAAGEWGLTQDEGNRLFDAGRA